MVKVPAPLRVIFDTFPLQTYPENSKPQASLDENEFSLGFNDSAQEVDQKNKFCLAVHNVQLISFNGISRNIPTDPFSLAETLILCHRHNLKLPTNEAQAKSPHSIRLISYLASPDKELPMLVESRGTVTESITTNQQFVASIASKYFSSYAQDSLFNQFLDNLRDLWIFVLISDIPKSYPSNYGTLFHQDKEIEQNKYSTDATSLKLVNDIPHWTSFKTRYAHIFNSTSAKMRVTAGLFKGSLLEAIATSDNQAAEALYFEKLQEFERVLPLMVKYLKSAKHSEEKTILELKLSSFVFVVSKFVAENTHIGRALKFKYKDVVDYSQEVIARY